MFSPMLSSLALFTLFALPVLFVHPHREDDAMDNPVDGHGKVLVGTALGPENEGSADGQLVGVCPRGEGQILIKKRVLGMDAVVFPRATGLSAHAVIDERAPVIKNGGNGFFGEI